MDVYISAPNDQETFISSASTETFDSLPTGRIQTTFSSTIGTYLFTPSAPAQILSADQYGGADLTRYISLGAQSSSSSPYTLQLTTPANYFGFWWSAGDAQNGVSFYSNGTFLARLETQDILTLLGNTTVTSINQQVYQSSAYFGNPNYTPKSNTGEPYAYVNIFASGTTFDQIVFDNSNTTATGFESDNHSVYFSSTPIAPEGSSVFVKEIPAAVPEPSTALLSAGAGMAMLLAGSRKKVRRRK